MVTPLSNRTSDSSGRPAPWRYNAVWDTSHVSIAEARNAVRTLLTRAGHRPEHRPSQDAQLVVSELVTNAVRHAPGPCGLLLEIPPGADQLRIAVSDSSPDLPRRKAPDAQRVGGHGLLLVHLLCRQVHTVTLNVGKQVVALLPLPAPAG
ncbi:ATP-binding protein [Streptomyces sp. NPDC005017]|uniref:ATP-binding protein n=1 Tax=Streptomyces sp. NPDC005017 TaxID=3364706 RepID=UPI0036CABC80